MKYRYKTDFFSPCRVSSSGLRRALEPTKGRANCQPHVVDKFWNDYALHVLGEKRGLFRDFLVVVLKVGCIIII